MRGQYGSGDAGLSTRGTTLGAAAEALLNAAGVDLHAGLAFEGRAAVLLGNTVALWPRFVEWLRAVPERVELAHPLDTFVGEGVRAALALSSASVLRVTWPYEPGAPGFVALAVQAGLLWRSPGGLGVHPVFGPWVALRALVVLEEPQPEMAQGPPASACPSCEAACAPAWARLTMPATEALFRQQWRGWAEARAACISPS